PRTNRFSIDRIMNHPLAFANSTGKDSTILRRCSPMSVRVGEVGIAVMPCGLDTVLACRVIEQQRGDCAGNPARYREQQDDQECAAAPVNHRERRENDADNSTTDTHRYDSYAIVSL